CIRVKHERSTQFSSNGTQTILTEGRDRYTMKFNPNRNNTNANPFDVHNSVDNDVEFGTNGGTTNLKIDKIERQICEGKLRLLDNDGNSLVPTGIVESDSEMELVFDETANLRISTSDKDERDKSYGTNSLLEQ
ncbi:hypothetical protein Tco_0048781, partial [Tanacetum coccineum]